MSTTKHRHKIIDSDAQFTIDLVSRAITNNNPDENLLMQGDHNSERFTFKIPRYIEGHDMLMCNNVQVPYINTETKGSTKTRRYSTGVYMVGDVEVTDDPNYVTCSWTISRNATRYAGGLNFQLVFTCMTGSVIDYRWKTNVFEGIYVVESIDAESAFSEEYVDVIEQWKTDVMDELISYVDERVKYHVDVSQIETNKTNIAELVVDIDNLSAALSKESIRREEELNVLRERIANIIALDNGSTTGDAELADARIDIYGRKHSTAGDAVRDQVQRVQTGVDGMQDNLLAVLTSGKITIKPIWELGGIDTSTGRETAITNRYRSNGYIRVCAPELTVKAAKNTMVIIVGFSNTENGFVVGETLSTEGEKTFIPKCEYYRFLVKDTVDDAIDDVSTLDGVEIFYYPNVSYARTEYVDGRFDVANEMIINRRHVVFNNWEIGGIDGSNGNHTVTDNRIRTIDFYKPMGDVIHYSINDGYRLLAYRYDKNYALTGMAGYFTGKGSFDVDNSVYFKFVLRGVNDFVFTGQEYSNVLIYSDLPTENNEGLPKYWVNAIESKEKEIKDIVVEAARNNQDIAMFYTIADPHYPANSCISTILREYLSEKCGITLSLQLGDFIQDSIVSHEEGLQFVQTAMKESLAGADRLLITQGNHDNNAGIVDRNGKILAERIIYDNEWIHHTSSKMLNLPNLVFDEKRKAFYYDDILQKIRFISIDSFEDKTYSINNGVVTSYNLGRPSDRQIAWIRDVALATVPNGYSVVSFSHLSLFPPYVNNGTAYVTVPHGGIGNGDKLVSIFTAFKNKGGTYIGHFAGHLHHDFLSTRNNITCVVNLNDGTHWREASYFGEDYEFVGDAPVKASGSVTECAFDVVVVNRTTRHVDLIRIGAGKNRSFDY